MSTHDNSTGGENNAVLLQDAHSSNVPGATEKSMLGKQNEEGDAKVGPESTDGNESTDIDQPEYATGIRLFLLMFTLCFAGMFTALEIGIIATAIPAITDEFSSLSDVGWYGSATFLVTGSTSAVWGKLYKYTNIKNSYLVAVAIFLVGSIVAATAQNSASIIVGRAVQGLGISGTLSGSLIVIHHVSHPRLHALLIGTWMGVFMISTILGPVVGGAFTSEVTWRWCFWINLPLGVPIVGMLVLFLRVPKHGMPVEAGWRELVLQLDLPGFTILLASLVCLDLALQWGGQTKAWSDGSVIATLVLWTVLTAVFAIVEGFQGARAMMPLRMLKPRLVWANALFSFM
jgi:MFS family permease